MRFFDYFGEHLLLFLLLISSVEVGAQALDSIQREDVVFESGGVNLAGTFFLPQDAYAAVVIVHGSGQVGREVGFAELLAKNNIAVLTYDKRGVGQSGGVYAGPEVGTNNIDSTNSPCWQKMQVQLLMCLESKSKIYRWGLLVLVRQAGLSQWLQR